jgi:alpha-tubulin suppressor-like RCC1 family protein
MERFTSSPQTYSQCNVPAGLSGVVAVAAGWGHNLALDSGGAVAAWGNHVTGQCNVLAGLSLKLKFKLPGKWGAKSVPLGSFPLLLD